MGEITMNINAVGNSYLGNIDYQKCKNTSDSTINFAMNPTTSQESLSSGKSMWSGDMIITLGDKLKRVTYGNTTGYKSKAEMTTDEYKQWFMNETAKMPVSGWMQSNFSSATVVIKDEAFERMKNDPEYEEYVMRRIRSYYSASGLNTGMNNIAYEVIGASPEECYGYAGPVGGSGSERITEKEKSWWEKRHEQVEELLKEQAEAAHKKRVAAREAIQREYNNSRIENERRLQSLISEQIQGIGNEENIIQSTGQVAAATAAYESSFIISDFE